MTPYTPLEAAEDRLRAAIATGDRAAIDAAADEVEALTPAPKPTPTLLASALWYAGQGLHVFPLSPGSKVPFRGTKGCLEATTDTARIEAWWDKIPDANVGIATGHLVDVVDIDGLPGQRSRGQHWEDTFAHIDAINVGKVLTPRPGGMHIYVPAQGDGNKAGIAPGVDYRGVGGYVVAPPSIITDGPNPGRYEWLAAPTLEQLAQAVAA